MKKLYTILLISLSLSFLSCHSDNLDEGLISSSFDSKKIEKLINQYRKEGRECGSTFYPKVEPVKWNKKLAKAAEKHSKDMEKNNFFNHNSSDGKTAGDRIKAEGYPWATYAENIARGYTTEDSLIEGWLNSEGHCKNIMKAEVREMGFFKAGSYATLVLSVQRKE